MTQNHNKTFDLFRFTESLVSGVNDLQGPPWHSLHQLLETFTDSHLDGSQLSNSPFLPCWLCTPFSVFLPLWLKAFGNTTKKCATYVGHQTQTFYHRMVKFHIYHHQTHTNKGKKFRLLPAIGRILLSINHHKIFMNTNSNTADATWLIWKYFQMNQDASLALHACEWVVSQKCYHQ
jgi:hypothetical protein